MDQDNLSNEIDTEMGSMLGESDLGNLATQDPAQKTTSQQTQTPAATTWKAGGREFKSPEELAKAYDNVWRLHSKLQNDAKPWLGFRDHLQKHPELRQKYLEATEAYHNAKKAGLSNQQAEQAAKQAGQMPPEVMERINRLEAEREDMKVEKELNSLRGKYKLDNASLREVIKLSEAHNGIPLEAAYKIYAHDSGMVKAKAEGAAQAKAAADAGKVGATTPNVTPAAKGINMSSDRSWREASMKELGKWIKD